jgi:hypothetical protein
VASDSAGGTSWARTGAGITGRGPGTSPYRSARSTQLARLTKPEPPQLVNSW